MHTCGRIGADYGIEISWYLLTPHSGSNDIVKVRSVNFFCSRANFRIEEDFAGQSESKVNIA